LSTASSRERELEDLKVTQVYEGSEYSRVDILGVGVSAINMSMAVDQVTRWMEDDAATRYVCVTGVHGVMESQSDPVLMRIHNASGMTTPDGMPMVWAGHRAGASWMERVYGPDLMLEVIERGEPRGWKSFLYGGKEGVVDSLRTKLVERFPRVQIVGTCTPPFRELTPVEDEAVVAEINSSGADIVWIGLSTPKQEKWMAEHADRTGAKVMFGVGAAFDIHAGVKTQAPAWMRRNGLEWLYRVVHEPRLVTRYAVNNPTFLWRVLRRPPRLRQASPPVGAMGEG
jgi:N-acetylglucosaminyldiphosphoundecaprenol N-acetyl-beta-D-mannosaminyltransferase